MLPLQFEGKLYFIVNKANLRDLIAATSLVILSKFKLSIFQPAWNLNLMDDLKKLWGDLSYITSSFVHHLKPLGELKLELLSGNAQFGSKSALFDPRDLKIWLMAIKNDKAPLLRYIKLCASFQNHQRIQTGVTVRKRLSWVMTSVTLTFDLWPWSFAWKSLLSLVITPDNFVMIRWKEHSEKGVTDRKRDGQTDGQKEVFLVLLGHS